MLCITFFPETVGSENGISLAFPNVSDVFCKNNNQNRTCFIQLELKDESSCEWNNLMVLCTAVLIHYFLHQRRVVVTVYKIL